MVLFDSLAFAVADTGAPNRIIGSCKGVFSFVFISINLWRCWPEMQPACSFQFSGRGVLPTRILTKITSLNSCRCWPENAACLQLPQAYFRQIMAMLAGNCSLPAASTSIIKTIRGRHHMFRLVCSLACMPPVAVPRRLTEKQSKLVGTL